jgi:hypothetical protein
LYRLGSWGPGSSVASQGYSVDFNPGALSPQSVFITPTLYYAKNSKNLHYFFLWNLVSWLFVTKSLLQWWDSGLSRSSVATHWREVVNASGEYVCWKRGRKRVSQLSYTSCQNCYSFSLKVYVLSNYWLQYPCLLSHIYYNKPLELIVLYMLNKCYISMMNARKTES